jgi:hypothetical protein
MSRFFRKRKANIHLIELGLNNFAGYPKVTTLGFLDCIVELLIVVELHRPADRLCVYTNAPRFRAI